eukprot:6210876-Pleurochrysis_carterae.AAC.1
MNQPLQIRTADVCLGRKRAAGTDGMQAEIQYTVRGKLQWQRQKPRQLLNQRTTTTAAEVPERKERHLPVAVGIGCEKGPMRWRRLLHVAYGRCQTVDASAGAPSLPEQSLFVQHLRILAFELVELSEHPVQPARLTTLDAVNEARSRIDLLEPVLDVRVQGDGVLVLDARPVSVRNDHVLVGGGLEVANLEPLAIAAAERRSVEHLRRLRTVELDV